MQDTCDMPDLRSTFIADNYFALPEARELPADASPRRYYRLEVVPKLLMEVEPGSPDFEPFVQISRYLNEVGLSAPRVFHHDLAKGLALIEDFGEATFTRLLAAGHSEAELYKLAVDVLIHLHEAGIAPPEIVPPYDFGPLDDELQMFSRWYVPQCAPEVDAEAFEESFLEAWHVALGDVARCRDVLVLRDYHVDNLMVVEGRKGAAACGLLDFQDGVLGSAAYDLVSLTQDARRELSPGLEELLVEHYLAGRPGLDRERFMAEYWLLAAHRHTKLLGNFERLSKRDGKHGYLVFIPYVQRLLTNALHNAGLDDIRALMDRHLPRWATHRPVHPQSADAHRKVQDT
ncbi:aminoglycoside phosphotransferase family protein [Roseibium sp.]|uniref:aminoglycoside phosphotransferase family protein n=1 Tax=Roseibium sp. TaxID=1936156 RepID=UPI003D0FB461